MEQTREAITTNLAERLCWQVVRRDEVRVARRPYREQLLAGVSPLARRGAAMRPGPRAASPFCPEALASDLVELDLQV